MEQQQQAVASPQPDARVPWMRNIDSETCLSCKSVFGILMNRRHHCRYCGGLFCHNCSTHKPKGVPGYESEEVRVCDICYYNDMAFLLVYNLRFSGWQAKTFSDRHSAILGYAELPTYASRIVLKIGSKEVVASWYARDAWRIKVTTYADEQIVKRLKPRIITPWIPTATQIQQRRVVHAASFPGSQPAVASASSNVAPASMIVRAAMVVFRQNNANATEHYWAFDAESTPAEALNYATMEMARIPNLGYGAVLELDGTVHTLLRTAAAFTASSQSAFEQTLQVYLKQLSMVCAWHDDGEYRSNYFPCLEQALEFVNAQAESVVMLDCNGSLVLAKNCSRSWREGLAKCAGRTLMQRQQLTAVIVCTAHVSRSAHNASTVRVYDNFYQAQRQLIGEQSSAIFGMPQNIAGDASGGLPTVMFLRRNPHLPRDVALSLAAQATAACAPQRPAESAPSSPSEAGSVVATMPECQICFIPFNPGPNKPCLCGACGNSVCYTCIRSMNQCAFCRKTIDPSAIITNVQLLQLVSGVMD